MLCAPVTRMPSPAGVSRGASHFCRTVTFSDEGSGTRVTWLQESESLGGVFKLADGLVMKLYSRDVRSNLEKAKTLLEA